MRWLDDLDVWDDEERAHCYPQPRNFLLRKLDEFFGGVPLPNPSRHLSPQQCSRCDQRLCHCWCHIPCALHSLEIEEIQ